MKSEDWVGHKFGRLTVEEFVGLERFAGGGKAGKFRFRCECGAEFIAQKSNVYGKKTSCGCDLPKAIGTHPEGGFLDSRYKVWRHMIDRCSNPNCKSFRDYGGRGITICRRWIDGEGGLTGFEAFVADLGPRPDGYTIERVDVNGNYEAGNCIWLPKAMQSKNRRSNYRLTIGGVTKGLPDWCADYAIPYFTAFRRLKLGWPTEKIFAAPVRGRK